MDSANGNGHSDPQHSGSVPTLVGKNKPRLVFWELTKGCNLRCIHCRATATELSSPSDLSTEAARDIIDQIAEVSNPILVLSGGEPLFRSDIFQLARYGTCLLYTSLRATVRVHSIAWFKSSWVLSLVPG